MTRLKIVGICEGVSFYLTAMSNNHKDKLEELNLMGLAEISGLETLLDSDYLPHRRVLRYENSTAVLGKKGRMHEMGFGGIDVMR